ncbi:MAG: GyrI-like domain-containing protein [Bacteroidales bacterium]|nr:GyrI-like domain-containing protein [Bacteroidales bacterium]
MKILKVLGILILVIIALAVGAFAYFGGFHKVEFKTVTTGGEVLVYEDMLGDYSKSPAVMDKVYSALLDNYKIETTKGIGIYFDNPQNKAVEELRSEIGCIVEPKDTALLKSISDFKIKVLPVQEYLVAEFPYKGGVSIIVGLMKVYPAMTNYVKENNLPVDSPVMEIYDVPNKTIQYRRLISQ